MASFNGSTASIPTPLVFFPPELAYQISVATYIHVGCTAVLIWDILDNLKNDWKLLASYRLNFVTVLYFVMRFSLLAYTLARAMLLTLPVGNCAHFYDALNALLIIFVASMFALFYIRVCAIHKKKRAVVVFYGILYLAAIAMLLTVPETFTAKPIESTQYCGENVHGPFLAPLTLVLMANDVCVYAGIAYGIIRMNYALESSTNRKFKLFAFGASLPVISKALMKDSQLYFLVVLFTNPFLVTCVYAFDAPLSVMFLVIHLVLSNILSCRVYRNIKMQLWTDETLPYSHSHKATPAISIRQQTEQTTEKKSMTSLSSHFTQGGNSTEAPTIVDVTSIAILSDKHQEEARMENEESEKFEGCQ